MAAALHSQPFQLGRDRGLAGLPAGLYPHLILRLGVTTQAAAGVRRPPGSVLVVNP